MGIFNHTKTRRDMSTTSTTTSFVTLAAICEQEKDTKHTSHEEVHLVLQRHTDAMTLIR